MTTFSQLVDSITTEVGRPDLRTTIATYLNQTIRECHFDPRSGAAIFYSENYKETQIVATQATAEQWSAPNPALFQREAAPRFDSVVDRNGKYIYPRRVSPGPIMNHTDHFYYSAGSTLCFGGAIGYGGIGATISISWFEYLRGLKYYESGTRPALYDLEDGWSYAADFNVDDDTRLAAREKTSNWMLLRWADVVSEGLRAKVYKRLADQMRSTTSYSLYMQLRQGLYTSEIADTTAAYLNG